MNLNKFTKAELISKLRKSDTKSDSTTKITLFNRIKSYFHTIWELILIFKSILLKITLISYIIKIFKKYKIFRRIWSILNTIVMSIFGISLLDNFGIEFIRNFLTEFKSVFTNTIDYLSNTRFYEYLNNLFSNKVEIFSNKEVIKDKSQNIPSNKDISRKSESVWTPSDSAEHKVSEWLKRKEQHISEKSNEESNYNKYLIMMSLLIGSCLVWVYFDEIKTGGVSVWEWINSFRPGTGGDPDNDSNSNTTVNPRDFTTMTRLNSPSDDIELSDATKGKNIMTSPSLENLNSQAEDIWNKSLSPTSSTSSIDSNETIKASSSNIKIDDGIFSNTRMVEKIVDQDWKKLISSNIKDSIEYVESHFPKSEIDDTNYIEKLINDVKNLNINYAQEIKSKTNSLTVSELRYANALAQKTDLWVEEMQNKLKLLEES